MAAMAVAVTSPPRTPVAATGASGWLGCPSGVVTAANASRSSAHAAAVVAIRLAGAAVAAVAAANRVRSRRGPRTRRRTTGWARPSTAPSTASAPAGARHAGGRPVDPASTSAGSPKPRNSAGVTRTNHRRQVVRSEGARMRPTARAPGVLTSPAARFRSTLGGGDRPLWAGGAAVLAPVPTEHDQRPGRTRPCVATATASKTRGWSHRTGTARPRR
jgi:hypothetical protein